MYDSNTLSWRFLVALVGLLMLATSAEAAERDRDRDQTRVRPADARLTSSANNCTDGAAEIDLDINNVRARLFNTGGLFWRGSGAQYEVPYNGPGTEGQNPVSIFASGIWLAGEVDGELRFAGSTYGPYEYWPGPLDANGQTSNATCQQFDRFWKVNKNDIVAYSDGLAEGTVLGDRPVSYADLRAWPIAYGAPFYVDANGNDQRDADEEVIELELGDAGYGTRQINLDAGERPHIIGDQGIWWVMNDAGNEHGWSFTEPIRMEVRALAFAFRRAGPLNNTTFYRYQFIYRGAEPMENSYIGIFSDPDLGEFNDDYVGSDLELGLGFVYNGDSFDDGGGGYGAIPPALGYDFFQGPLVNDDGEDNDGDGETDEEDERLAIEKFFYFTNGGGATSDPGDGAEAYLFMQGFWKDGTPLKEGNDGYNTNGPQVDYAFPGNPPAFWSEYNADGAGRANTPADRRFGVSSGPITFEYGDKQEIVFGIVWAQAPQACASTPTPQIASLAQLKFDDITVQGAFNADFVTPAPPPSVEASATPLDQEIVLQWRSSTGDNNDLFTYEVESPFVAPSAPDQTYNFEGFKVIQYRDAQDQTGTVIYTADINNSVTTVIDEALDCNTGAVIQGVVAQGQNSGTELNTPTYYQVTTDVYTGEPLRNNTTYYFGIQPYAYNEFSSPNKIFAAPITRVEARPSLPTARDNGTVLNAQTGQSLPYEADAVGEGVITARVTNPSAIIDATYRVEFFTQTDSDGEPVGTNYNILRTANGTTTTVLDGAAYYARTGEVLAQNVDVLSIDGLVFDVQGPAPALSAAQEVVGGTVIDGTLAFSLNSASNPPRFFLSANGASPSSSSIFGRMDWQGNVAARAPIDYEIRFVENPEADGQIVLNRQWDPANEPVERAFMQGWIEADAATAVDTDEDGEPDDIEFTNRVEGTDNVGRLPFQVWEIYPDGTERQVMAAILDDNEDLLYGPSLGQLNYGFGYAVPYERIYVRAVDYDEAAMLADPQAAEEAFFAGVPTLGRILHVPFGGHSYLPAPGTTLRFVTTKPNLPGDVYTFRTTDFRRVTDEGTAAEEALDLIAITPNPYRGQSDYEASGAESITRIVNLPAQATVRVFTLSGTLIRTLEKSNPGTTTIDWDLRTEAGLPVASGIYLIHVEARRTDGSVIGERVLKFGVIQRRTQLDVL